MTNVVAMDEKIAQHSSAQYGQVQYYRGTVKGVSAWIKEQSKDFDQVLPAHTNLHMYLVYEKAANGHTIYASEKQKFYKRVVLQQGEQSVHHTTVWIIQLARALCYLHDQNFILQNLTINHLLLNEQGVLLDYLELQDTKANWYQAPEQDAQATKASNVFHFGMIVYEMATGMVPFAQEEPDVQAKITNGYRPKIPGACEWRELIESCWHQNKAKRPTMKQLLEQLLANANAVVLFDLGEYEACCEKSYHDTDMLCKLALEKYIPAIQILYNRDCPGEVAFDIAQLIATDMVVCPEMKQSYYTTSVTSKSTQVPFIVVDKQNEFKIIQSMRWFIKSAEKGYTKAQHHVGIVYKSCKIVQQDYKKAAEWFLKAAEQGYALSQVELGTLYHDGTGVEWSIPKAVEWYKKAAAQNNADALVNLGVIYVQDCMEDAKAYECFSKAMELGNPKAITQANYGLCFFHGHGVKQDYSKAVEILTIAADRGDPGAQCFLAECYKYGYGVGRDQDKATKLYLLSEAQGYTLAKYKRYIPASCIIS